MLFGNNISDKKWRKFLSRIWLFKFIPFVDFVLAAGSLATGDIREDSDFDVIVGVRQGRIFSVRMFCYLSFSMFGWWARHPEKSKNRLCFNHFVTPEAYRLSPPYNEYWKNLYRSLVPVFGNPETIQKFYDSNADWTGERRVYSADARHLYKKSNWIKLAREWILSGNPRTQRAEQSSYDGNPRTQRAEQSSYDEKIGNLLEEKLKLIQVKKNEANAAKQETYAPRIIFNDNELEFHPDTRRTYLK